MEQSIKFSIIIPVYNVQDYLVQCVDSILIQSYRNFELILIDDGSPDQSGEICDRYAQQDKRVRVIHKSNAGPSDARNTGIDQSSGDYLIFLDSDDFWTGSTSLLEVAEKLLCSHADVLCLNFCKTDGYHDAPPYFSTVASMPVQTLPSNSFTYLIRNGLWTACAWNKVISAHLFHKCDLLFRTGITSEDIDWCIRLALCADSYDYNSTPIICYRQREGSISKATTITKTRTLFENIKECIRLLEQSQNPSKEELLKPYLSYQFATLLIHTAKIENPSARKEMITEIQKYGYLLGFSSNSKVRLMQLTTKLCGLSFTVMLLRMLSNRNFF